MSKEKRWVVLAEDGRHVTLGRATDPSDAEVARSQEGLVALGLGGWLAVTEGTYYSDDEISVLEVRVLGDPGVSFAVAVSRFLEQREIKRL